MNVHRDHVFMPCQCCAQRRVVGQAQVLAEPDYRGLTHTNTIDVDLKGGCSFHGVRGEVDVRLEY
jgi:hypothetical protein